MASLTLTENPLPSIAQQPQSFEAEQALLGILLHHNASLEHVVDFLRPDHFADPLHGRLFEAIRHFIHRGQLANPITLSHYFKQDPALLEVGGNTYLAGLAAGVVSLTNALDYAQQIYELYLRRQLIYLAHSMAGEAYSHTLDKTARDTIEKIEKGLFELAQNGRTENAVQPFSTVLTQAITMAQAAFQKDSHIVGVTTGFVDLDKLLGGLHPSDLVILAGRPSMGKTALATNIAFNAALASLKGKPGDGGRVAFFSLEMSSEQLALRLLGQETRISSDAIRRGAIQNSDFPVFLQASQRLSSLPLYIDDTPALNVATLRARARRLQRQEGLDLIVIDYLQLLSSSQGSKENRVQELSEITRSLKGLAKELNLPILALSQLSRAVELREDKRPQLSDLRESGTIEQDADVVMFVYRDDYYLSRKKPLNEDQEKVKKWQEDMAKLHNVAEVIVAKQRHGPTSTVQLHFEGAFTKFSNFAPEGREQRS